MTPKPSVASASPTPIGLNPGWLYAVLAYGSWGLLPIYWKFFQQISAVEVLTQRIIWSLVFLSAILIIQGRWQEFAQLKQRPRHILGLLLSATLLTCNWGLYIYGVNSDRVIETSLGYFINPLVTVLLGFVFLQERLRWGQRIAVGLATLGVGYFIWQFGAVPWIGLGLAFTFAFYGLLRKLVPVNPMVGLAVETGLITPAAIAAVGYWAAQGSGHLGTSLPITLLFIGAGVVTSMPLLRFNNAAKRLRLSTLGLFQYVAPSIQLALGVFLYQEPFTTVHGVTFGCIWSA
ncbi:MAG: EamA family transporter RarD, partial [Cyanobacteria bacterium P01_D01_bin.128]